MNKGHLAGDKSEPMTQAPMFSPLVAENMRRLFDFHNPMVAVDVSAINIDDLLEARPFSVIRVRGNPHDAIMFIVDQSAAHDCIAGWISEE